MAKTETILKMMQPSASKLAFRTCFSSVSFNGYKLDILKSAVQKYLRRREFHKMVWCVGEIYLFQVYAKSDVEKRAREYPELSTMAMIVRAGKGIQDLRNVTAFVTQGKDCFTVENFPAKQAASTKENILNPKLAFHWLTTCLKKIQSTCMDERKK